MGWFDSIKSAVGGAVGGATEFFSNEAAKYTDWAYADAIVAIAAGVASADGELEAEERQGFADLLKKNEVLARYDRAKMAKRYDELGAKGLDVVSREDLYAVVEKIAGDKSKLSSAIRFGVFIAKSDGDFEQPEGAFLLDLCARHGIDADTISPDIKASAGKPAAKPATTKAAKA